MIDVTRLPHKKQHIYFAQCGRGVLDVFMFVAAFILSLLLCGAAHAQAQNPFSVGISEGGGAAGGVTGWILALQASFEHMLSAAVRNMHMGVSAWPVLMGVGFAYGVFHAAGPGHGKAVIASYMLANERALKQGMLIAFAAAFLQGCVAVSMVSILALVVHATALSMRTTAHMIELMSFASIALLGLWLMWRKGTAFLGVWNMHRLAARSRFMCEACGDDDSHVHGPDCGHIHMPDPALFSAPSFAWKNAIVTIFAAGARPCSGAILVLVFALAQGVFSAGIAATFAMSLGTALTSCALAALAVCAKDMALRLFGQQQGRGAVIGAGVEFCAAVVVFVFGFALFFGFMVMGA
jgi:ABC-type nickel/cobalt efflux system permease component RcnA